MAIERLQKIIAAAGVASRRKAEELITSGRVQVNGTVVTELGTKADSEQDHIRVDGKLLRGPERHTYIVLNKPKGYVTTVSDPEKRPTVMDLVGGAKARVYPVGRLDWASEGLLLLTNDGELANSLMKASSNVPKTYVVKVAGQPDNDKLDKLRAGVSIAEKGGRRVRTAPAKIRPIRDSDNPWFEVTIIEGRNRQVRKMFEEVGHHVEKIRRVQYGPLALDVPPGEFRSLTLEEISQLKAAASGKKTFVAARPEVMPTVVLHATKPMADSAIRTVEVPDNAKAKVQFRPRIDAPAYSKTKPQFRQRTDAPRSPQSKPPFRPSADRPTRPTAGRPEYRGNPKERFSSSSSRAKSRFTPSDKKPYRSSATTERREGENRGRTRGITPGGAGAARGSSRPPFRERPYRAPEDRSGDRRSGGFATGPDSRSGSSKAFERPSAPFRGPRPPFKKGKSFGRPKSGSGSGGPKTGTGRPFRKTGPGFGGRRSGPGATGKPPSSSSSRPRGPRR